MARWREVEPIFGSQRFEGPGNQKGSTAAQFIGMLLDFVPEAILLGTAAVTGSNIVYLLTGMIALQNMPEGFASYHEMQQGTNSNGRLWLLFLTVPFSRSPGGLARLLLVVGEYDNHWNRDAVL